MNTLALLLSDTYKQCHDRMYPKGLTKLVSYWVPRKSMLETQDKMVFFGLNAFIQQYLVEYFHDNFFGLSEKEILSLYTDNMNIQIGEGNYDTDKIIKLHRLGYLPLEIRALPEGALVPMGVPCIEISNTHDDFAWLVQWIECILQVELWKPCCHATIGYMYRQIADYWYNKTVDGLSSAMACADFGMRGMSCMEEAIRCSASWLLSFNKTSTIPAINYIDKYYNANCKENGIGLRAVSTEHSVMGANYAIDGDEITFVKKLLNELYPNTSFSMVSDTYDYWNMVNNILPQCKEDIMKHNGKLLVRPDSGNIVDISVKTVQSLWDNFGGTINSKGYKVLDPHIGVIYGDGCTLTNVADIWSELEKLGFAANNIFYGVGAFCFSAVVENGKLIAMTRDTFGIAMKATYGVIDGKEVQIYKDPKTDTNKLKKSHKGCCIVKGNVIKTGNGQLVVDYTCSDGHSWNEAYYSYDNVMDTVFKDGKIAKTEDFATIRHRLHGGLI
jgi:nicotinamide phosphoribosyltransferase